MLDVSIYVEKGDRRSGGCYGFVFDHEEPNIPKEHKQRGWLSSPDNLKRQLEGLVELLKYALQNKMRELCVRTRSGVIRDAINHHNGYESFDDFHRIYDETNELLLRILELCGDFQDLNVEFVSDYDESLEYAQSLAHALWVYTDGSCLDNGLPWATAGAAVYLGSNHHLNGLFPVFGKQTNNRAEYTAIIKALEAGISLGANHLIIYTDCDLIIQTMKNYIYTWKTNGWITYDGKPVENQALIKKIDSLAGKRFDYVNFVKVDAHSSDENNKIMDRMAKQAAVNYRR